jgi:AcrR family transcriptional regulator
MTQSSPPPPKAKAKASRTYRGASSADRAQTRRAQLIAAAIETYGLQGYRRTSVKQVCAAAGLTDRYFYEAFDNSEALLAASFEAVTDQVLAEITKAAATTGGSGAERARAMLAAYFTALRRETARAKVFLVEMVGISDDIDRVFDITLERIAQNIIDTLDPKRIGPLCDDPLLARGVASGLIGIAIGWVRGGHVQSVETVAQAALKLCLIARPSDDRP